MLVVFIISLFPTRFETFPTPGRIPVFRFFSLGKRKQILLH
jgi:hypothetical protein